MSGRNKHILFWVLSGFLMPLKPSFSLESKLLNQIVNEGNPYRESREYWLGQLAASETQFCGIRYSDSEKTSYELRSFASLSELSRDGYSVTHKGSCGTCSTLQDLSVYQSHKDLTAPVRKCGSLIWNQKLNMKCLLKLGFTHECAKTWHFNTKNTAKKCFKICLKSWISGEAYNLEDGALNSCLACDEYESGPAFKTVAGRTRRRSGLISAIGRPESEIFLVPDHRTQSQSGIE